MSKNYEQTKHEQIVKEINAHVFKKLNVAEAFSPRPVEIEVRNCTKIDRNIQTDVVSIIANHLLSCSDQIPLASGSHLFLHVKFFYADLLRLFFC